VLHCFRDDLLDLSVVRHVEGKGKNCGPVLRHQIVELLRLASGRDHPMARAQGCFSD